MPQTIVDKHWCWFTDYVFLYADWTINLAEGREVEVGTGLMIKGKPRGSIFKVRKHCNFRTFGAGAIHVRVIDELHPIKRTPQPNEESRNAEIQPAEKDLAIHQ